MIRIFIAATLALGVALPATAQEPAWRSIVASVPAGTSVKVRLTDGRRFNAVLVEAREDAVLLQPKTRQPLPVQPLPYTAIAALERIESGGGMSAGKAIAIGAATGAGIYLGMLLAMLAALD